MKFTGWLAQSEMLDYIAAADVGAAPYYSSECIQHTLGNKFFDYMSLGKPIVATDSGPVRRLFDECDCGLLVPSRDEEALAAVLRSLLSPTLRRRLGENGLHAVRGKYNWKLTDGPLVVSACERLALSPEANAVAMGRAPGRPKDDLA